MNSFERRALILGAIIAVVVSANIVYAAIGNNTLRQNYGAVMPLFNATGGGYYVHNINVINAAREADFTAVNADEFFLDTVNKTDIFAYPQTEASYIIWSDGGTPPVYYAKNGQTGQVTGNANWETLFNMAAAIGGKTMIKGAFIKTTIPGLTVPSNFEIEIPANSSITFGTNVGDGAVIFTSSDTTRIKIHGAGVLDGNRANQGIGTQSGISLTNVTLSTVDIEVSGFTGLAITEVKGENNKIINRLYPNVNPIGEYPSIVRNMLQNKNIRLIDDIENDGTWAQIFGTLNWSTDERFVGSSALNLTTSNFAAPNYRAIVEKTFAAPISLDPDDFIGYFIKIPEDAGTTALNYYITFYDGDGKTADINLSLYITNIPHYRIEGEWVLAGAVPSLFSPTINWGDVTKYRIKVYSQVSDTYIYYIDGLYSAKSLYPQGSVTITVDDQDLTSYTDIFRLMNQYGYSGVRLVNPVEVGDVGYVSLDQLREMYHSGWDIANHGWAHHDLTAISLGEAEEEILRAKDWLIKNGFEDTDNAFSLPNGHSNEDVSDLLERHYPLTRMISSVDAGHGFSASFFEPYNIRSTRISDANLASIKILIDWATLTGCHYILDFHSAGPGKDISIANFIDLLDYIEASGVRVATFSQIIHDLKINSPKEQRQDLFMDVLAVSATQIRSNEDLSAAIPITFTLDAQPDVPRTLSGHFDSHAQITAYTLIITGLNTKGRPTTETITEARGWDWETNNAFSNVTSIIMIVRTGTGVGDTIDIGITDVLGLSTLINDAGDIYKIKKNNANQIVAAAQINTAFNTYDMSVIGLAGGDDFTIWYLS